MHVADKYAAQVKPAAQLRPSAEFCSRCDGRLVALLPHPDNPARWLLAFEYEPDGFTPSTRRHICRIRFVTA